MQDCFEMSSKGAIRKKGSCPLCQAIDDRWMVQCDNRKCDKWYHLRCVGLTQRQADEQPWYCNPCTATIKSTSNIAMDSLIDFDHQLSSTKVSHKADVTVVQRKQANLTNPFHQDDNLSSVFGDMTLVPTARKRESVLRPSQVQVDVRKPSSVTSSQSIAQQKMELLKRKAELVKREQELIEQQLELLNEMQDDDSDDDLSVQDSCYVSPVKSSKPLKVNPVRKSPPPGYYEFDKQPHYDDVVSPRSPRRFDQPSIRNPFIPGSGSTEPFNMQRWTARHALPKSLPTFTGKPEEWVTFISAYEHSNEAGGYTNVENLPRLESSIKGAAREFVKSLFTSSDNVPRIMNTLRRMFGRPEQLMRVQLDEIRRMRRPDSSKPETVLFFAASVQNLWSAMKASNMSAYMNNPNMMQELVEMLPESMKWQWSEQLRQSSNDIESFTTWLEDVSDRICTVNPSLDLTKGFETKVPRRKEHVNVNTVSQTYNCIVCDGACTSVEECEIFLKLDVDGRWNVIKAKGLCRKCLKKHMLKPPYRCAAEKKCDIANCPGGHHPLVHRGPIVTVSHHVSNSENVIFRYVPVKLTNGIKVKHELAFMDGGSSGTFMDEDLASELELTGPISSLCIKHTSDKQYVEQVSMRVSVTISGTFKGARNHTLQGVQTMRNLSLEEQTLKYDAVTERFAYLKGLPVESYDGARPRILIGLNNWHLGVPTKVRTSNVVGPIAARCKLGWTIYASTTEDKDQSVNHCRHSQDNNVVTEQTDEDLHRSMRDFFSLESLGVRPPPDDIASIENRLAYETLRGTTRLINGRVETGLLWKSDILKLPDSAPTALRRLKCLEYRMRRDPQLASAVKEQMEKYVSNGYLRKLSTEELATPHEREWYLPVFPVTNPNKPGRVRMVFDAAQEVDGVSLNSVLMQGPDLVSSLVDVLMKFRQEKIAISGDIKDMFLRVKMRDEDQHCQRVLWRDDPNEEPSTYVLQTLTFGATCSPSSAMYAKNINAQKFCDKYPRAVEAICNNHYVDDYMDSVPSEDEAITLANQVKAIHQSAGFCMHQWRSNSTKFMQTFGETHTTYPVNLNPDQEKAEKILGMWWLPESDYFTFSLKFNKGCESVLKGEKRPTKRDILRILMSLYDPLGLLTHYTSYLKVLLQDIWRSKVTWDEVIEDRHMERWNLWLQVLPSIEQLRISRCFLKEVESYPSADVQLHIFVDASRECSAAVAYLRIQEESKVVCSLVMAKSRVAPMKLISVPKLELVGAVLGARLSKSIKGALTMKISKTVFWSDSRTVLLWLRSDTKDLNGQFEQFKVAEIQDLTEISSWRYIPSKCNVADDATKWQKTFKLDGDSRWFEGPAFLYENELSWPVDVTLNQKTQEIHHVIVKDTPVLPSINYQSFYGWKHLCRAIAYCKRVVKIWKERTLQKRKSKLETHVLTSEELSVAEMILIKCIQADCYDKDISYLRRDQKSNLEPTVPRNSSLYKLSPGLFDGVLKIRGRTAAVLQASSIGPRDLIVDIPPEVTNPIILPREHVATRMLIQMYHEKFRHVQHEAVVNKIRQLYCIPALRQALKSITRNCSRCKILNAQPNPPEMAPLPEARLSPFQPAFLFTGLDCLGPIVVTVGRRNEKRWVVLFTCLTYRAVHLEIVHGMDHDSFLMALMNFMNRRGEPREIFSDNGTNFVKGERILREEYEKIDKQELAGKVVSPNLKWNFNPPESPHMGGSWERLVKSVKQAFYAIPHTRTLNDQLLRSYLMEVENIVNSRPLTYVPLDTDNEEALTPNHYIRGHSEGVKPIGTFSDDAKFLKSNWMMSQLYARKFWKRWVVEYLPELTRRTKWYAPVEPMKEGDVVLIVDPDSHRNRWPRGRIVKVNTSSDGQVRSAIVQTSTGLLTRPMVKLAKLDILESEATRSSIKGGVLNEVM